MHIPDNTFRTFMKGAADTNAGRPEPLPKNCQAVKAVKAYKTYVTDKDRKAVAYLKTLRNVLHEVGKHRFDYSVHPAPAMDDALGKLAKKRENKEQIYSSFNNFKKILGQVSVYHGGMSSYTFLKSVEVLSAVAGKLLQTFRAGRPGTAFSLGLSESPEFELLELKTSSYINEDIFKNFKFPLVILQNRLGERHSHDFTIAGLQMASGRCDPGLVGVLHPQGLIVAKIKEEPCRSDLVATLSRTGLASPAAIGFLE